MTTQAKTTEPTLIHGESRFDDAMTFGSLSDTSLDHNPLKYIAVRQGEVFHAVPVYGEQGFPWTLAVSTWGYAYRPIHEDTTFEDVEGSTYAWLDDGKYRFAPCSPDAQRNFASQVHDYAYGKFSPRLDAANLKTAEATNAVSKTAAAENAKAIAKFASAIASEAQSTVIAAELGHYHRNPHNDHMRDLTVAAINSVLEDWTEKAVTDLGIKAERALILDDAAAVKTELSTEPEVKHRAQLAAEAAAREAASKKE